MATIAIVDDSESILSLLGGLIKTNILDCSIRTFSDSREGLCWCLANEVELIVIDYVMPDLDGLSFLETYRKEFSFRDVPVVMVTSDEHRDTRYRALHLGATDFLRKPIDADEFVTRVRNLLALSLNHKALADRARWLGDEIKKATTSLVERERETIMVLSRAAEHRDNETGTHLKRMAEYCRFIAEGLGLSQDEIQLIHAASPMHDVGKIGVPDCVLLKPGRLSLDEYVIMQAHAEHGFKILSGGTSTLLKAAAQIALRHHEKYDGTGYPHGLSGDDIPLVGRIAATADVFDALTSERPYKRSWPLEEARSFLVAESGRHFDPRCVEALLSHWPDVCEIVSTLGNDRLNQRMVAHSFQDQNPISALTCSRTEAARAARS